MQVLIAEDERDAAELYRVVLESRGHIVTLTFNGRDCVDAYKKALADLTPDGKAPFDVVVLDYRMPVMDGLQAAREIARMNSRQRIIFASAYVKETLADSVKTLKQVVEMIQKPFDPDVLVHVVEDLPSIQGLKRELNKLVSGMNIENPTDTQLSVLLEMLRKIQKARSITP